LAVFVGQPEWIESVASPLARTVVGLHAAYLVVSTIAFRHVPIANVWEAFTLLAFALGTVYLVLEWQHDDRATGVFMLSLPLLFQIVASAFAVHSHEVDPILKSPLFGVHVTSAMIGYAAFSLAAVYGTLYILLYRELKKKRMGLVFQRLPPLESLSRLNVNALVFGWGTLTLAIVVGIGWAAILKASGELIGNLLLDPKSVSTAIVWVLYSSCLGGRYFLRWSSRNLAYTSVITFGVMILSAVVVGLFLESFHSFT
jgi:ABC-type transport system involved in cytochrome c biogenesis permease subunit